MRAKISIAAIAAALVVCGISGAWWLGLLSPEDIPLPPAERPAIWAQPMERPGLPNLHRVSEALYRGAQPSAEGFRQLEAMGMKTVVNLRALNSDRDEIGGLPLRLEEIRFKAWHPEDEDVVRFLRIVADKDRAPVFVHCQHGADRTGMMCAIYRVAVCGWSNDEAIREMRAGGFGFHEAAWQNIIRYLRNVDVAKLKKDAGLP